MEKMIMSMVIVAAVAMIQCAAAQTAYVVGDNLGWAVPPNGAVAYTNWTSNKHFMVGDILVFNFVTNQHDVQQVTRDSYDACTSANPIGNLITNGPANITLTSAGDHYYICTVGRHCQAGQRLAVTVSSGTPGGATPPSNTTPTHPTTPSPTSNNPTPDAACAPTPSSTQRPTGGPIASTPPDSSSPALFASLFLTLFSIAMGFIL